MQQPPYPSLTPTWHNDTYPAIDPLSPELRQTGKTVVITGAVSWPEFRMMALLR